ncbi:hypothetical protein B484DRAFT_313600, partial [Ochromonadaceae sp. CCMP2298]
APPAGLKNLGASCYVNVALQTMFHNPIMADALFNMETETADQTLRVQSACGALRELQYTFARMKLGFRQWVDPSRFTELAGVDEPDKKQEDCVEFQKQFLQCIDSVGMQPRLPSFLTLAEAPAGQVRTTTTCSGCQAATTVEATVYELALIIEDCNSVGQALSAYINPEVLEGDNAFECLACRGKQKAERTLELQESPTVLLLHLPRFKSEGLDLKKLKNHVSVPDELKVGSKIYKLVSVIYHKGSSPKRGHYVCDVLNWTSGDSWRCNDESV